MATQNEKIAHKTAAVLQILNDHFWQNGDYHDSDAELLQEELIKSGYLIIAL